MRKLVGILFLTSLTGGGSVVGCGNTSDDLGSPGASGAAGNRGGAAGAGGKSTAGASGSSAGGQTAGGKSSQGGGGGTAGSGKAGSGTAGRGTAGSGTAGSGTAGSGTAGSGTAGSGTAGSGGDATCGGAAFPTFDKGCGNDKNCSIGVHTTDCCGNAIAQGFNHGFRDAFDAAEKAWDQCLPSCGCPAGPTVAEDGNAVTKGTLAVSCTNNVCKTFVEIAGGGGSGGAGGGTGGASACPADFPTYNEGCTVDANCSFGLHQLDCCGSLDAVAFNHDLKKQFEQDESAWRVCKPAICDCLVKPTTTDKAPLGPNGTAEAFCQKGVCLSRPQ